MYKKSKWQFSFPVRSVETITQSTNSELPKSFKTLLQYFHAHSDREK
jgi:hypothetical protein